MKPDMSCWVVPSVAAEFWGVSLDVVWTRIYAGQVPHKRDGGFIFVDVAPWGADFKGVIRHQPPMTYVATEDAEDEVALAADEVELLAGLDSEVASSPAEEAADREDPVCEDDELPPLDEEESATFTRFGWQESRQRVGRTRIPPMAA
jgi:hypothetical protein